MDWASTPLGPPADWPQSLRSIVRMMLSSRYPMWMGWGPELSFFYNDAYAPTLGVKHPWAIAQPASSVWREIWHDIGPLIDHVLRTGEATYNEGMLLFLERSGFPEETYHTFSYSPLFDDAGGVAGMFCVVVEETERVLSERRLGTLRELASATAGANSEAELFRMVGATCGHNLSDLPFTLSYLIDEGGATARLVSASGIEAGHPAAPETFYLTNKLWPFEALLGNTPAAVVDGLARSFQSLPAGAWDKPPTSALVVPIAQPGLDRAAAGFFVVGLNPYRRGDTELQSYIGLLANQIGSALANVRAYEAERRRAEALAEIDTAKTTFFSNVSHEFRTPLTLMLGPLETILSSAVPPEAAREQVELAHRNGARLLRLVNSLLDFSRLEAGRVRATYEPTDIAAFSAEIASSFRSATERAGLALDIRCASLPEPVYLDRDMWEKVLLNLISNAFKFTFEGAITVSVEADPEQREAVVRVRDTGIGIPAEELPKLFVRFHRVEGARGRSFEGSGIGLALVQELVKLHGGQITAESTPGAGTELTVRLPFGRAHLPAEHVDDRGTSDQAKAGRAHEYLQEALRWLPDAAEAEMGDQLEVAGGSGGVEGAPAAGTGKRVLLADDNADMRDYVRRLLAAQGYAVETVGDGDAALAAARRRTPDLILTDVMMPGLDGFGLLQAIRADPTTAGAPVIMLSARAGEEAKIEGLQAGADDYLVKPFGARELLARVGANIRMAEIRREAAWAILQSEQQLLMTEDRLSLALSTGRIAVFEWEIDSDRVAVLGPLVELFGMDSDAGVAGLPLSVFVERIHLDDRERVMAAINQSVRSREPYEAEYRLVGGPDERIVIARGRIETLPEGGDRMSGALIDITEERLAANLIRDNRAYLRELLNSTDEGFYAIDRDGATTIANRAFMDMLGFAGEQEVLGRRLHDVIHHSHADGSPYHVADCPLYRAASLGEPAHVDGELFYRQDGTSFPVEYRAQPIWRDGVLMGAICTFADVSRRLAAQAQLHEKQLALEEQTRALQILNRAAAAIAGDLDLARLVQAITDAGVEVSGAQFGAFFYNVPDEQGESFMLYTLSGAPREAFASFPKPRNTAVFGPTFSGEGVIRSDDITQDPRYGLNAPFHGMPEGHLPVKSYLAVPVISRRGQVLGGLLFGHSSAGVFTMASQERVVGLASQAAVAMDNASLFQAAEHELAQRRRAEADLQALNASLEERVATEIAERAKAEDALRQAQKMEAVGQLTGGVAHDFNNLLTVIIGGLDTIRRAKPGDDARIRRSADMALQGAQRAASLTGRLLAFSRRQPLEPKRIELNGLVRDMSELLHRTLGEQVELEGVFASRLWAIEADQNQLEAAILNLAVNARDAMPEGGKLTIETANTALDEAYAATDAEVIPGQYVVIAVSDSGVGMSADTVTRVFEPFFTTKDVGRGTGLGLSMVYGFVKQSGGHVTIYSEPGQGTTVKMYFPRYHGEAEASRVEDEAPPPRGSQDEVVLVVEDNEDVRVYSTMILHELGYRVLEASDMDSALAILRTDQRIDLLFTDVVLPGKSGRVLADAALELRPGLNVLFTTGYSRNAIVHHGRLDPGVQLITKPFTFDQLAARVRDVLDRMSVSG